MSLKRRVVVGKVAKAFGTKGELKVRLYVESPEVFLSSPTVVIGHSVFELLRVRKHKGDVLLTLAGVEDPETAKALSGLLVSIDSSRFPKKGEDEYYFFVLEGLRVLTPQGKELGIVHRLFSTGANDVVVVRGNLGEILLPWIDHVIVKVDLEAGLLVVDPLEGLVPDD